MIQKKSIYKMELRTIRFLVKDDHFKFNNSILFWLNSGSNIKLKSKFDFNNIKNNFNNKISRFNRNWILKPTPGTQLLGEFHHKYGQQFRSLCTTLKNEGSICRDHLANERTFLAYCRTGLAFLGAGTGLFTAYSFAYSERQLKSNEEVVEIEIETETSIKSLKQSESKRNTNSSRNASGNGNEARNKEYAPQNGSSSPINSRSKSSEYDKRNTSNTSNSIHPSEIVPACGLLILNGALVLGFAIHRYLHVQEALMGGNFVIASRGIKGLVGTTVISTIASLSIIYKKEMESKPQHLNSKNSR